MSSVSRHPSSCDCSPSASPASTASVRTRAKGRAFRPGSISGCPDSNWGPLRPERSALPGCATPRARAKGSRASAEAPVDDERACVLDIVEARLDGDSPCVGVPDAQLEPERPRPDRDRVLGHGCAVLGPAEDVHEVHGLRHVGEGRIAAFAENLARVRVHRDAAVAGALQVAHDPVRRAARIGRRTDHRDRPRLAHDLFRAPHYPRSMPDGTLLAIAQWREGAERLAEEVARDWELQLGEPYVPGFCGHVVRATTAAGVPAVLKVFFPEHESLQEADALERWGGDGAIRLLDRDDARCALLLERCKPGAFLSSIGGEAALDVLIELLPRGWERGGGLPPPSPGGGGGVERGAANGAGGVPPR